MIAGVATETIVESTRIMKKPRQSANMTGQGRKSGSSTGFEKLTWNGRPMTFDDLMAGPPPTRLPEDPAVASLETGEDPAVVVRAHPESPAAWASLAERALADGSVDDITA